MEYPRSKFLSALALGRGARYFLVAYLGSIYGHRVFGWLTRYYQPILYVLIALGVLGGLAALYYWRRYNVAHRRREQLPTRKAA